jgi:Holliday junction resolvase-like predicted endonuclease
MDRRPRRRRHGDRAELIAQRYLADLGWTVLDTNVGIGRDELDVVAVEPGETPCLVFVEVRSNATGRYGAPEESVIAGKLWRTYRAAWALLRLGALANGAPLPRLPWRVDVVIVEQRPNLARGVGGPVVRHLKAVAPE